MDQLNDPHPPAEEAANVNEAVEIIAAPQQFDVLLGRGRGNQQHVGNKRLQEIVDLHKNSYFEATSRRGKVHVAKLVVASVNEHGRFLRYDNQLHGWVEVSETIARQKVCQALQYHKRRGGPTTDVARERGSSPSQAPDAAAPIPSVASLPGPDDSRLSAMLPPPPLDVTAPACSETAAVAARPTEETVSSVAGLEDLVPRPISESKQGEPAETDSDFLSIIRALSQGAHFNRQHDREEHEGPAPA